MRIGYARVSTLDQNLDLQEDGPNPTLTLVANSHRRSIGRNLGRMGSLGMGETRAFVASDEFATSVTIRVMNRKVAVPHFAELPKAARAKATLPGARGSTAASASG